MLAVAAFVAAAVGAATLLLDGGDGPAATSTVAVPRASSSSPPERDRPTTSPPAATAPPATTAPTTAPPTTDAPPTTTAPAAATAPASSTEPPPPDPGVEEISGDDRPVELAVPAIDVDAPVTLLGLTPDDRLEVPSTAQGTGWWSGGSAPGTPGPAVIAGHVNLGGESGVFAELSRLDPGDEVRVRLDAGQEVRYRVDRVERHAKDAFPTDAVYGPTTGPELRLVTCGGAFDPDTGRYEDNVVAFATLVG